MSLRLDQTTFRRLILGYAVASVLAIAAAAYEMVAPEWRAFSDRFDALVEEHFGAVSDATMVMLGIVLAIGLIVHVIALVGLWRYWRWARAVFWVSLLVLFPIGLAPGLNGPVYAGSVSGVTDFVSSALFGAIVLMAYSKDHGTVWFGPRRSPTK